MGRVFASDSTTNTSNQPVLEHVPDPIDGFLVIRRVPLQGKCQQSFSLQTNLLSMMLLSKRQDMMIHLNFPSVSPSQPKSLIMTGYKHGEGVTFLKQIDALLLCG